MTTTLVRATLLPGFGQINTTTRRIYGAAVLGFVASALTSSQSHNDEAERLYARWQELESIAAAGTPGEAATLESVKKRVAVLAARHPLPYAK